jgi:hypothetical protein
VLRLAGWIIPHDGQQLLIPQGSRILGEAKRVTAFGQERLAVLFHRVIMPDGYSVSLDQFKGLNQVGETGLRSRTLPLLRESFTALMTPAFARADDTGVRMAHKEDGEDRNAGRVQGPTGFKRWAKNPHLAP